MASSQQMFEQDRAQVIIQAEGVSKTFGTVRALSPVSVAGRAGSVHAITGENGAGKSTLMKILAGVVQPTTGHLSLNGDNVRFSNPRQARDRGISTVFQEFTLLPNLTVAENIFLGREGGSANWLSRSRLEKAARNILSRLGLDIDPSRLAGRLSVSEQQLVEISKGIAADASVFIFDEPTAALNATEVAKLEAIIHDLQSQGKSIFYISHRLEEIFRLSDTVTVLKDGQHVATVPTAELNENKLVNLMVGRPIDALFPTPIGAKEAVALSCDELIVGPGWPPIGLSVHRGEIVGLAGLDGQGQTEIVRTLAGLRSGSAGRVLKASPSGEVTKVAPHEAVRARIRLGIGFVPGDRKAEGLYLDLSVSDNILIGTYRHAHLLSHAPARTSLVAEMFSKLRLRADGPRQKVVNLSGGNQQKVLLARALSAGIDTLLIEEPTRGVDVGAKAEIYRLLRTFVEEGGAVLVYSSELPELIGLCDRILVVRQRKIVAEFPHSTVTEETIMGHALGAQPSHLKEAI